MPAEPGGHDRENIATMKHAAFILLNHCVRNQHKGGIARGLGESQG